MPHSTASPPRFPRFYQPLQEQASQGGNTSGPKLELQAAAPTTPRRSRSIRRRTLTSSQQKSQQSSPSPAPAFVRPAQSHALALSPPIYAGPHHGSPCSTMSLCHLLTCDHKVHTPSPEPCASNCHIAKRPDYSQPRSLDSPFVCPTCLAEHLQDRSDERELLFRAEIEAIAADTGEDKAWADKKVGFMRLGWAGEDEEEVSVFYEFGRGCEGFWVDDQWKELVQRGSRAWRERTEEGKGLHVFGDEFKSTANADVADNESGGASPTGSVRSTFEKFKRASRGLEFRMPVYGK